MRCQGHLLPLDLHGRLDIGLQPAIVLITNLHIQIRKPPVIRGSERISRVIPNRRQVLQYLIPDPVPRDEEVSRIEPLRSPEFDPRRVKPSFLI